MSPSTSSSLTVRSSLISTANAVVVDDSTRFQPLSASKNRFSMAIEVATLIATVNVIVIGRLKLPESQALGDRRSSVRFSATHHLPTVLMCVFDSQARR